VNDTITPRPVKVEALDEGFTIKPATPVVVDQDPDVAGVARLLAERLRVSTGYALPVRMAGNGTAKGAILLTIAGADPGLGEEGYELTSTCDGITIRAPHAAGLFYGVQSLRQLLPPDVESDTPVRGVGWKVPGIRVWDKPRFPVRSFLLDSGRHLQSVEFIKRTIDLFAVHKLNRFHWHLTDDQGWRLEIRKYPRLTQIGAWRGDKGNQYGGFYTQAQVRDIVKYAAARFVTIVPEVEMPGHSVSALASYPDLGCTDEPYEVRREWGISEDVLCPGKEATLQFVEDILTEVIDLFPSKVIHIGGDECPRDRWKVCPNCQALMKREGLKDEDAIQNHFTRRMMAFLAKKGRRLQGWNEIMTGGALPEGVIVHQWNWPNAGADAAKAGNDVVYSMTPWLYFDYDYATTPLEKVYACEPVPHNLAPDQVKYILGPEACLWTEHRPTDASDDDFTWPRAVALAEVAWTGRDRKDWGNFADRMVHGHYQRLGKMGLGVPGPKPAEIVRALTERSGFAGGKPADN
jgi:hexosaminidase